MEETQGTKGKPRLSQTNIDPGVRQLNEQLPCQVLTDYVKPTKKFELAESFTVADNLYEMDSLECKSIKAKETAYIVSKLDLFSTDENEKEIMPTWMPFNAILSDEVLPLKRIGFPVTNYSNVYTA